MEARVELVREDGGAANVLTNLTSQTDSRGQFKKDRQSGGEAKNCILTMKSENNNHRSTFKIYIQLYFAKRQQT